MICLICALDNELEALKKHLECVKEIKILNKNVYVGKMGFKDIALVKSGIGKAAAAATTALLFFTSSNNFSGSKSPHKTIAIFDGL